MSDFKSRLVDERRELAIKWTGLGMFLSGDTFRGLDEPQRLLLSEQYVVMERYIDILTQRLDLL